MDANPAPGWYPDPSMRDTQRYWDGARWTEHVAPVNAGPAPAATDQLGPDNAAHWLVPVGRSWQSITAGYLAFLCLIAWIGGPFGVIVGGVTLWLGIWGMRRARAGGHGRGRAIFGIVAGSLCLLAGGLVTVVWLSGS